MALTPQHDAVSLAFMKLCRWQRFSVINKRVGYIHEIIPSEKIVATDSFADEKGNVVPASHYGMNPDFPLEMMLTVTFEDYEGKTKLTLHHVGFPSDADKEGARQGWNESLDKLEEIVLKPLVH